MIAVKLDDIEHYPIYDPASQLIYTHNGHRVSHSWVQGKALMSNRELLTINEKEVIANTKQWQTIIENG